jgi:hypothetical protein
MAAPIALREDFDGPGLWWHDEARIGPKNKRTRRWARRGTRPSAPPNPRTAWASIFGAICPAKGKGAGLVLPYCGIVTARWTGWDGAG